MKQIKDYIIYKSTPDEHNDFIEIMKEGLHNKDPKVGIFWYNPSRNELFGVEKISINDPNISSCPKGKTCSILHKKKWQLEYRRNKPRGRIFYKDGIYNITVGSWINEDENYRAIDLIEEEFDLTNEETRIIENSHWSFKRFNSKMI